MFLCKPRNAITALATILSLAYSPLQAEQVTLKSLDGTVSMTGDLLEYDGVTYLLGMLIGEISIDASQVVCEGDGCPNLLAGQSAFSIAGSAAMAREVLPPLLEVFALDRGGDLDVTVGEDGSTQYNVLEPDGTVYASVSVQAGNSLDAFTGLLEGSSVIGMSARPASANEISAFDLAGNGRLDSAGQARIVAMDGVIAAVNADNPVKILSLAQLAAIFEGDITNWRQVGGPNAPINVYRRSETADTSEMFFSVAMSDGEHAYADTATVLDTDAAVSDAVAADRFGLGLTSYAQERNARAVTIRSVCGELFEPDEFAIKTESYPLTRRMYFYNTGGAMPDVAAEFLDFINTEAAQSVIRNTGFVDQSASWASLDAQGRRMAQAIVSSAGRTELLQLQDLAAIMLDADRLSFTLRYTPDGELDARALADIERLAGMIRDGDFTSRQMLVFGFSDNQGAVNARLGATQEMAQTVRDAIVAATGRANMGNVRISPIGYGRLMPLGCNETPFGRAANNRVEIWLK